MIKKSIKILLIISCMVLILNIVLLFRYTGYAISSSQGQINLRIIISGALYCGDGVCNNNETCSDCPQDCGSCIITPILPESPGGKREGFEIPEKDFFVSTNLIKIVLKKGESFKKSIVVKNTANSSQAFEIVLSPNLEGLVFISENVFILKAGEEKIIYLNFMSSEITEPGVYTGNLKMRTESKEKSVLIIDSIKSKEILFDLTLDIPTEYRDRKAGEQLLMQVTLFNLAGEGKNTVFMNYIIKDFKGNIITQQSEDIVVETQISFSKTIELPLTISPGDYLAITQAKYGNSFGSSSVMFQISGIEIPQKIFRYDYLIIGIILIILLIFLFVIFKRKKRKNSFKNKKRR